MRNKTASVSSSFGKYLNSRNLLLWGVTLGFMIASSEVDEMISFCLRDYLSKARVSHVNHKNFIRNVVRSNKSPIIISPQVYNEQ